MAAGASPPEATACRESGKLIPLLLVSPKRQGLTNVCRLVIKQISGAGTVSTPRKSQELRVNTEAAGSSRLFGIKNNRRNPDPFVLSYG